MCLKLFILHCRKTKGCFLSPQSPLSPAVVTEGETERRTSPKAESPSLALPSAHTSPAAGTEMVLRQAESQLGDSWVLCPHGQLRNESDPTIFQQKQANKHSHIQPRTPKV